MHSRGKRNRTFIGLHYGKKIGDLDAYHNLLDHGIEFLRGSRPNISPCGCVAIIADLDHDKNYYCPNCKSHFIAISVSNYGKWKVGIDHEKKL